MERKSETTQGEDPTGQGQLQDEAETQDPAQQLKGVWRGMRCLTL